MRAVMVRALGMAGALLLLPRATHAQFDAVDAQINAWTDCTVMRTIALADRSGSDEELSAQVMQSCAQYSQKLEAAAKAKRSMTDSEVQELVTAVGRSQEQSIPLILAETRAARSKQ